MWIKGAVWISVLVLMMILYQRRHHARIQLLKGSKTVQARVRACRPVFKMIHPGLYQSITYHIELEWIEEGRWQTASIDLDHEIWPGHVLDLVSMADGQWQIRTSGVTRFPYRIYLLIGSLVFMMCLVDQLAQQWSGPQSSVRVCRGGHLIDRYRHLVDSSFLEVEATLVGGWSGTCVRAVSGTGGGRRREREELSYAF